MSQRKEGVVYVIAAPEVWRVKIGYTTESPQTRLLQLQTASPVPLVLVGSFPGSVRLERDLHAWFADKRRCGEWFDMGIVDEIDIARETIQECDDSGWSFR